MKLYKDIMEYIKFRIQHLKLEEEKIPFTVEKSKVEQIIKGLKAKQQELHKIKKVLDENVKEHAEYERRKVQHLKKMKIFMLMEKNKNV